MRGKNAHFQIIVTKNVKFPIFYDNAASAHVVEQNLCHLDFSKLLHGILKIDTCISVVNKNEEIKYMLLILFQKKNFWFGTWMFALFEGGSHGSLL